MKQKKHKINEDLKEALRNDKKAKNMIKFIKEIEILTFN